MQMPKPMLTMDMEEDMGDTEVMVVVMGVMEAMDMVANDEKPMPTLMPMLGGAMEAMVAMEDMAVVDTEDTVVMDMVAKGDQQSHGGVMEGTAVMVAMEVEDTEAMAAMVTGVSNTYTKHLAMNCSVKTQIICL